MRKRAPPCPDCGKPLSLGGRFCRGCGWDADLEASEDAHLDGVDLPGEPDDEAYEEVLRDAGLAPRRSGRGRLWALAALVLLVAWILTRVL